VFIELVSKAAKYSNTSIEIDDNKLAFYQRNCINYNVCTTLGILQPLEDIYDRY